MLKEDVIMTFLPYWLYPDPQYLIIALCISVITDVMYPKHLGVLYLIHPVHTSYFLALKLSKYGSSRAYGVIIWFVVITIHITPYSLLLYISWRISPILWVLISSYIIKVSISPALLLKILINCVKYGTKGNYSKVRTLVQEIVRRDLNEVDLGHVYSAGIESLFENIVDAVTSPLLLLSFLGPIGALFQRIVNTLDGALGYKVGKFRYLGWFSALMDTIINYIPARLVAILTIITSSIIQGSMKEKLLTYIKYRCRTDSINAGHPISAIAASLGVRLEKIGHYVLGEGELPRLEHVSLATELGVYVIVESYLIALLIILSLHAISY